MVREKIMNIFSPLFTFKLYLKSCFVDKFGVKSFGLKKASNAILISLTSVLAPFSPAKLFHLFKPKCLEISEKTVKNLLMVSVYYVRLV